METIVFVLCVDTMNEYPKSCRGNLLEIDLPAGAQKVPASDSKSAADDVSVFTPNPDLALP